MGTTEDHVFSPQMVGTLTLVDNDLQRDWRRRGLIESYGKQNENGRWLYSFRDIVAFYAMYRLGISGMDRLQGAASAWWHAPALISFLQTGRGPYRFAGTGAYYHGGVYGRDSVTASALSDLEDREFYRLEVMDLKSLAETAPADLIDSARGFLSSGS